VSSMMLSLFVCRRVNDGAIYLVADFSQLCYSPEWMTYIGVAVLFILMYPIGVPTAFFFLLRRYKARLNEPDVQLQLGFLYEAYNSDMYYFELADMANKLVMTSLVTFLLPDWQLPAAMVFTGCFITLLLIKSPYIRKGDDRLHMFVEIEIFLLLLCGYILQSLNATQIDSNINLLISIVLIALTIGVMIMMVLMTFRNIRKMFQKRIREQLQADAKATGSSYEGGSISGGPPLLHSSSIDAPTPPDSPYQSPAAQQRRFQSSSPLQQNHRFDSSTLPDVE